MSVAKVSYSVAATRAVTCADEHTCTSCGNDISKGAVAIRCGRRAVTYHERCNATAGFVHWYRHPGCVIAEGS